MATDRAQVCWLCVYLSTATMDLSTDPHSPETWSSGRHAPVDRSPQYLGEGNLLRQPQQLQLEQLITSRKQ
ncbi:hypothetical protein Taro_026208 [Colocasia esculenta]|uniref:Uncharacterized protein n=1 Tax=Colocasia esculenta TaxID=4460 RepID=A0A843VBC7_COLES|nr:hypothetical protein [Colocasia esculenta]